MARCLVLGAGGFIGQHLVAELAASGIATRSFMRSSTKFGLSEEGSSREIYYGNFLAPEHISHAFEGCDTCVHLITTTFPRTANHDVVFDVESNLVGTLRLLEVAKQNNCKKVVFISSGGTVYGNVENVPIKEDAPLLPISSYGLTKATIERYFNLYRDIFDFKSTVLRVANPFGPLQKSDGSQGLIPSFLRAAMQNKPVRMFGDGSQRRDYVFISDVAKAIKDALLTNTKENTFNIGSGVGHSVAEILEIIQNVTGKKLLVEHVPLTNADVSVNFLDISLARAELGWTPSIGIDEGIARTYNWMQNGTEFQHL